MIQAANDLPYYNAESGWAFGIEWYGPFGIAGLILDGVLRCVHAWSALRKIA